MFDELIVPFDLSDMIKDSFIILVRSEGYHNGIENEKQQRLALFYNTLKQTGNLKQARIESGFNFKEAKHYIDFLNLAFVKRTGKPFYTKKLDIRKRKK